MDEKVAAAVRKIRESVHTTAEIGILLGSGLGSLTDEFMDASTISYEQIPQLPMSMVKGHKGELVAGEFSGKDVMVFSGRLHYYEGYSMQEVCFPVKILGGLGIHTFIVTNACGAVNEDFSPGDIAIISDHINLTGDNPLRGSRYFVNMTEAYSKRLRNLAHNAASRLNMDIKEGVYMMLNGPSYESPAEIIMARNMGADMIGMSTIPEVIMANSLHMEVLGLSIVTNMAAGITGKPLSHEEVIETTAKTADRFRVLLGEIIKSIG